MKHSRLQRKAYQRTHHRSFFFVIPGSHDNCGQDIRYRNEPHTDNSRKPKRKQATRSGFRRRRRKKSRFGGRRRGGGDPRWGRPRAGRSRRRWRRGGRAGRRWRATGGRRRGSGSRGRGAQWRWPPRTRSTSRGGRRRRRRWGWGGRAAWPGRRARGHWRRRGRLARSSRGRGPWGRPTPPGPPPPPPAPPRPPASARWWRPSPPWSPTPSARTPCTRTHHPPVPLHQITSFTHARRHNTISDLRSRGSLPRRRRTGRWRGWGGGEARSERSSIDPSFYRLQPTIVASGLSIYIDVSRSAIGSVRMATRHESIDHHVFDQIHDDPTTLRIEPEAVQN